MRLTLRQLEIFQAIAETGATTLAADQLALSQSATSAGLQELEAGLEARLFDRVGKRLQLNDNGRLLLPQVRQVLQACSGIESHFRSGTGHGVAGLRLGLSTTIGTYMLPELMADFATLARGGFASTVVANTNDIATAVAELRLDLGLIEGPAHRADLQVEPWMEDAMVVVSAPGHFGHTANAPVSIDQLRQARWLLREPGSGTRETVEQGLLQHLQRLDEVVEFNSSETIQRAVAKGLGVSCLSRWVVAESIASGRLEEVSSPVPVMRRQCYLIMARQKYGSDAMRELTAFLHAWAVGAMHV